MRGVASVSGLVAAAALLASPLFAELTVDPIYASHMVLQRGRQVPICGTCTDAAPIEVSFAGQKVQATVKGNTWRAVLAPMEAQAEGANLTVSQGDESVTLEDVVVGEVWIASGQSNMFWRLVETRDRASLQSPETSNFRFYHAEPQVHTGRVPYTDELRGRLRAGEMYSGAWSVNKPDTRRRMSAVGWYFARALQSHLGVPVGVVHVSNGGSEMLAWMPKSFIKKKYPEVLAKDWVHTKYIDPYWVGPRVVLNLGDDTTTPHPYNPGYLFETGIKPWLKFPVAGVVWYQGESDAGVPDQELNTQMLTDFITSWREAFKNPQLPFCMVQLPRIKDPTPVRALWPEFREVQRSVSHALPNVFYAVTIDLGTESRDVHPPRKIEVSERLAALAATEVYNVPNIPTYGPLFARAELVDGRAVVSFDHAEGLSTKDGAAPRCFELSADGKTYYPAEAEVVNGTVQLRSSQVETPRFVRYAWAVFVNPNLVNSHGLPAEPFSVELTSPSH